MSDYKNRANFTTEQILSFMGKLGPLTKVRADRRVRYNNPELEIEWNKNKSSSIEPVVIEKTLAESYLDYSLSVILNRALPDINSGFKPVHIKSLYALTQIGAYNKNPYKKSARVVGEVIGKYHPHGDTAVYDALVSMAQDFKARYPLIDGHGNFGSNDPDNPAAMRYTEMRLSSFGEALLQDLSADTVNWIPNYDGNEIMPSNIPSRLPMNIINGTEGIAVGFATSVPPHNLKEVANALVAIVKGDLREDQPEKLFRYIKGPDFPGGNEVIEPQKMRMAYMGDKRGKIIQRAKATLESSGRHYKIVFTSIPHAKLKANLMEKLYELAKGHPDQWPIKEISDESNKEGTRIVVTLKAETDPNAMLSKIYNKTMFQDTVKLNPYFIEEGRPINKTVLSVLVAFVDYRRKVVSKRTAAELRDELVKLSKTEGLITAIHNKDILNAVIETIRNSADAASAEANLLKIKFPVSKVVNTDLHFTWNPSKKTNQSSLIRDNIDPPKSKSGKAKWYRLTGEQAKYILNLPLYRLTASALVRLETDYAEMIDFIMNRYAILNNPHLVDEIIISETKEMRDKYGDDRRTDIVDVAVDQQTEIPKEDLILTLSEKGNLKTQSSNEYKLQHRGGTGKNGSGLKQDDAIKSIQVVNSHDTLLFFTNKGIVYTLDAYNIPKTTKSSNGKHIKNFIPLTENEYVTNMISVNNFNNDIMFVTKKGKVKKTCLDAFTKVRTSGIVAIKLADNDEMVGAIQVSGNKNDIIIVSDAGKAVRFKDKPNEPAVNHMGRTAAGVQGMKLGDNESVISINSVKGRSHMLLVSENGFGKRTSVDQFSVTSRNTKGVFAFKKLPKTGKLKYAMPVSNTDEVIIMSKKSKTIVFRASSLRPMGRNASGNVLITLADNDSVASVTIRSKNEI